MSKPWNLLHFEPATQTSMIPTERGLNLLNEVPTSRTCEDAGILPHWCTCSQQKVLSNTNESVRISNGVVNRLLFTCRFRCMLGYFFKNQSGKIRNMNGKRSSSFPTDVCRTAPNLIPWSLRKNKTVLFKVTSLLISSKIFYLISGILDISVFMCDRRQILCWII
jgi:hypothetical protein